MQSIELKIPDIIQAFNIISNPTSDPQKITYANTFLLNCQKSPKLPLILINIYSTTSLPQIRLQSLLHLSNIIKRTWQIRRSRESKDQMESIQKQKPAIRIALLQAYQLHNLDNYKHFNQIFKCLTRQDYPLKYEQLHNFLISSLKSIWKIFDENTFQNHTKTIKSVLSTIKTIIKQYSIKKISHNEEIFTKYVTQVLRISIQMSNQIHSKLDKAISQSSNSQYYLLQFLLQIAKKIDKINLYCLECMPNTYQFKPQISQILRNTLQNLYKLTQFLQNSYKLQFKSAGQLQCYLSGVLQRIFKMQGYYPFSFTTFLGNYLTLILNMLLKSVTNSNMINHQRLVTIIIQANLKPFTTYVYYMTSQQFLSSVYNRKGAVNSEQLQRQCHQQFKLIFTNQVIPQYLSSILTQVMTCKNVLKNICDVIDHQMVLQQSEVASQDTLNQLTPYQHCILLTKNIVRCFKNQLKESIGNLFLQVEQVGNQKNNPLSQRIMCNSMQVILILPKIYQQQQLPIDQIVKLLQILYYNHQFGILARLIKNYNQYFNQKTIEDCFRILTQVVSTPITDPSFSIDEIYQCALTMKKMLTENQSQMLPLQNLPACLQNLVSLIRNQKIIQTPTLVWPLINLSNQLLKLLPKEIIINEIGTRILNSISPFFNDPNQEQLIVCGIGQILENIMNISCSAFKINYFNSQQPENTINLKCCIQVLSAAVMLLETNIKNTKLQNVDNLYHLWLTVVRNYPTLAQQQNYKLGFQMSYTNNKLQQMFSTYSLNVLKQDSMIFLQILQQYLIVGFLNLNQSQLLNIFSTILNDCFDEHRTRTITALFSLYFTFFMINNSFIPDLIILAIKQLQRGQDKVSPQQNCLRTIVLMIFDIHILKFGTQKIFQIVNSNFANDYTKWFYSYCWSHQYVSNKFGFKLNGVAMLKIFADLGIQGFTKLMKTPIENSQIPQNIILKLIGRSLQPLKKCSVIASYNSMLKLIYPSSNSLIPNSNISRKIRLHLSCIVHQIIINDYRDEFSNKMTELFKLWDWGQDDLYQKFQKSTVVEIIGLLNKTYRQNKAQQTMY